MSEINFGLVWFNLYQIGIALLLSIIGFLIFQFGSYLKRQDD